MRQFVAALRSLLINSGPECEMLIRQSLRVLFSDLDRSPLNLIPERHLEFLGAVSRRPLVGSGLKKTVLDMLGDGSYTRGWVLEQFSDLLAEMIELGERLKNMENSLRLLNITAEAVPQDKAVINATIVPNEVSTPAFNRKLRSLVGAMRELCRLGGGGEFKVDARVRDRAESVVSFTVERPAAALFCVIYLGILDTYAYISNFDTQIDNLKLLKTSGSVIRVLEKEKKRMLGERLVVSANIALAEFFKPGAYSRDVFDQTHAILLKLMDEIEEGFEFDVETGQRDQADLAVQMQAGGDKLLHYLFAINKLMPRPRKGLRAMLGEIAATGANASSGVRSGRKEREEADAVAAATGSASEILENEEGATLYYAGDEAKPALLH
jgi:hypothetical protein